MDKQFEFNVLGTASDKAAKAVSKMFARAGQNVVNIGSDSKVRRTAGVTYKELLFTFASGQTVALRVKSTGDVWQVTLNGSVVPVKNQGDTPKAVAELSKMLDANEPKYQAKLAKVRAELPKGIKTAAPKMQEVLTARTQELDTAIGEAKKTVADLRAELGEPKLDSIDDKLAAMKARRDPDGLGDPGFERAMELAADIIRLTADGAVLDGAADLSLARLELGKALDVVTTNLPFSIERGDMAQAELQRESAAQFRTAMDILDKAADYQINHKTFSAACSAAIKYAEKQGYTVDDDDWHAKVAIGPRKPDEGKTNRYSILLTKDGKEQKKALQMQIYGKGDAGYELNCYVA